MYHISQDSNIVLDLYMRHILLCFLLASFRKYMARLKSGSQLYRDGYNAYKYYPV